MANKNKVNKLSLIIIGAIFALWNLIVFTCFKFKESYPPFWASYAFVTVAFAVVCAVAWFVFMKKGDTLNTLLPFYSTTYTYLIVTFIFNNIVMLLSRRVLRSVLWSIIPNAIIIVAFIIVFVLVYMGASHIKGHENYVAAKVSNIKEMAYSVNALTYKTTDAAVKSKLVALRDKIKISDPLSGDRAVEIEGEIKAQIETIGSLLSDNADSATVISAIDDAYNMVKLRNGLGGK
ncbi:MAG: hypothetical protein E7352_04225 [Clostridiales bacterium]|nr:hypothetical protein [Clostridiales bacterium]